MNMMDRMSTKRLSHSARRTTRGALQSAVAALLLLAFWMPVASDALAQISTAPFLENEGLVVMEAENVPRDPNWQFENIEEGWEEITEDFGRDEQVEAQSLALGLE